MRAVRRSEYMSPYCGSNQSHTHYTGTINAKACQQPCPGPQSAALPDCVPARPTSVRARVPPCKPRYTTASTCPACANSALFVMHGSCPTARGSATRQRCRAVGVFWSCLFQPPVIIHLQVCLEVNGLPEWSKAQCADAGVVGFA